MWDAPALSLIPVPSPPLLLSLLPFRCWSSSPGWCMVLQTLCPCGMLLPCVVCCVHHATLSPPLCPAPSSQVLVFFTWVVRGAADTVSMWDAVERVTSFCKNVPEEIEVVTNNPYQVRWRCSRLGRI